MTKKTSITIILLLLLVLISATACRNKDKNTNNMDPIIEEDIDKDQEGEENTKEDESGVLSDGIPSPLSGIYGEEEKVNRRPVAVMFDNDPKARWQAGLSQAEVVYEFLVEPPYTRYMGIFLLNEPEVIGPVRSARPYFIATLLEYDPLYVRVGGSEQAKEDVKKHKVADIDGLYSGVFWRNTKIGKKAPNNTYTSMEGIRKEQKRLNYKETGDYKGFLFNDKDLDIEGKEAKEILIKYYSSNTTKYEYDAENKVYKRYKDKKLHIDETDEKLVLAKNIFILEANTKIIDGEGRMEIQVIGQGKGYYITNGKYINITWKKASINDKIIFLDEKGNEIKLNPGITWIQFTKPDPDVDII
ncbi:DUF3048 domain-containing protein [Proteiniborus sp. MB09-C3]|uniref:DUF3048 domain-containing protein n=1 Tax=Proteiniborus sp. MB09-C3 TaxID=3050072 RepID=UPI002555EFB5|nr:DUF3048 domain-containing protein [Proteiniborus sp. MB09-C3]WIV10698.1 DUF3048 domain-containing protein [Proteiniborus sp. MB09-C3]